MGFGSLCPASGSPASHGNTIKSETDPSQLCDTAWVGWLVATSPLMFRAFECGSG